MYGPKEIGWFLEHACRDKIKGIKKMNLRIVLSSLINVPTMLTILDKYACCYKRHLTQFDLRHINKELLTGQIKPGHSNTKHTAYKKTFPKTHPEDLIIAQSKFYFPSGDFCLMSSKQQSEHFRIAYIVYSRLGEESFIFSDHDHKKDIFKQYKSHVHSQAIIQLRRSICLSINPNRV